MPKIIAWKCPHTGALFDVQGDYKRHLAGLSRERVRARNWAKIADTIEDTIAKIQKVNNMQEWCDFFLSHQEEFIIYGVLNDSFNRGDMSKALENGWVIKLPKLKSIKVKSTWNESVSNSHNCPRKGYTNWGASAKVTTRNIRGYPGWHGRVTLSYKDSEAVITIKQPGNKRIKRICAPSISDMTCGFHGETALTGLNTGSGGGGGGGTYEASMFQEDFPNMEKVVPVILTKIDETVMWKTLKRSNIRHKKDFAMLDDIGCGEAIV